MQLFKSPVWNNHIHTLTVCVCVDIENVMVFVPIKSKSLRLALFPLLSLVSVERWLSHEDTSIPCFVGNQIKNKQKKQASFYTETNSTIGKYS